MLFLKIACCKILLILIACCLYTCNARNMRQLKREIDIIKAKQELESKIRKADIETVFEKFDDVEEKIANIIGLINNTEEHSLERENSKGDSDSVRLLSEDIKSLKDNFSRLVRAFSVEKEQNIHNKIELTELNKRVEFLEHNKKEVTDLMKFTVDKEIAKLEQVFLNITDHLKEQIEVNADLKEDLDIEVIEDRDSEKEETNYQYGSCLELLQKGGKTENGIYTVHPQGGKSYGIRVYCDQTTDGGGWTVFQRRKDGSEDFFRNWGEYKVGFGSLDGEFWLGNDYLSVLTSSGNKELRIDLEGWENDDRCYAKYDDFRIGPETENYSLNFSKFSEGTCGDSLTYHKNMQFSTRDRDNDKKSNNCAENYKGAWWYNKCLYSGLNGIYYGETQKHWASGVYWYHWKRSVRYYSCKSVEMKFR